MAALVCFFNSFIESSERFLKLNSINSSFEFRLRTVQARCGLDRTIRWLQQDLQNSWNKPSIFPTMKRYDVTFSSHKNSDDTLRELKPLKGYIVIRMQLEFTLTHLRMNKRVKHKIIQEYYQCDPHDPARKKWVKIMEPWILTFAVSAVVSQDVFTSSYSGTRSKWVMQSWTEEK